MNNSNENVSKKPKVSNFHQQSLPSWNPLILISTIYPLFGSVGLIFIMFGIALLLTSKSVREFQQDYTNCNEFNSTSSSINRNDTRKTCSALLDRNMTSKYMVCTCKINFTLDSKFEGQVYFYYLLKNFHQNHRRYFSSRDDSQLVGDPVKGTVSSKCDPISHTKNGSKVMNYAPCGLIANSIFNDTFQLFYMNTTTPILVQMTTKGIAWKSDIKLRFGKPKSWNNTLKPINWPDTALKRNKDSYKGDEELMVWMRAAPLSTFKKLNRLIVHDNEPFKKGLPAGKYQLLIQYAFPVTSFGGKKIFVLGTTNFMGGKNINMAIMYLALGGLHEIIAIVFLLITFFRQTKEHSFSDTPLIMSPLSPEGYGIKEPNYNNTSSIAKK